MGVGEDERVNVPVCVLDILLSVSCADRRWKMTRADKHASEFPSRRRQKHGRPALSNLFAEPFPCAVPTSEGTERTRTGKITKKRDGVQATQSNMKTLKCSSEHNATMKGKINGLTHDGCLF